MYKIKVVDGKLVSSIPDGEYSATKWVNNRSLDQLRLLWVLYGYVDRQTGNSSEDLHRYMKKQFLSRRKLVKLGGKRVYVLREGSTKGMSKKAFSEFYSKVEQFFAELGYVLPPHDSAEFQSLYANCPYYG